MKIFPREKSLNILLVVAIFFAAIFLNGCAPRAKFDATVKPDWVDGASHKFSSEDYFVGKGHALALDVAAKYARDELKSMLSSLMEASSSGAVDKLVQEAEVVDAWRDAETKQHYALVVLKHTAATKLLRDDLKVLDDNTRLLIRQATTVGDPLAQIRATRSALSTWQTRADLLMTLHALGDDASADDAVWSTTEMQVHLKSLMSSIDIAPQVEDDRRLSSAVVRGLDAAGHLSKNGQPSYVLKAVLQRLGMKWEKGWFTERGTFSVELLDKQQKVTARAHWPLKVQAQERSQLEKELMNEVENTLRKKFAKVVLGLLED